MKNLRKLKGIIFSCNKKRKERGKKSHKQNKQKEAKKIKTNNDNKIRRKWNKVVAKNITTKKNQKIIQGKKIKQKGNNLHKYAVQC